MVAAADVRRRLERRLCEISGREELPNADRGGFRLRLRTERVFRPVGKGAWTPGGRPRRTPGYHRCGQKSGIYSAFDPDTGDFLWGTQVGPGGDGGGIQWGSATDCERIYVAIANSDHLPYTNPDRPGLGTAGSWSALDPTTGEILWQIPDPNGAQDIGPMTVANGVVYAPSTGAATASTP